jgi:hypothetical protein
VGNDPGQWPTTGRKAIELATIVLATDPWKLNEIRKIAFIPCTDGSLQAPEIVILVTPNHPDADGSHFPIERLRGQEESRLLEKLGVILAENPRVEELKQWLNKISPENHRNISDLDRQEAWNAVWELFSQDAPIAFLEVLKKYIDERRCRVWVKSMAGNWTIPKRLLRLGEICTDQPWANPYRVNESLFGPFGDQVCNILGISSTLSLRNPEFEPWFDGLQYRREFRNELIQAHGGNVPRHQDTSIIIFLDENRVPGPLDLLQDPDVPRDRKCNLVHSARMLIKNNPDSTLKLRARYIWNNANIFPYEWQPSPVFSWAKNLGFDLNPPEPLPDWASFIRGVQQECQAPGDEALETWRRLCAPVEREQLEQGQDRDLAWLTLFLFACAHSSAWGSGSRARGFVDWCLQEGHLQTMIANRPSQERPADHAQAWVDLLWRQTMTPDDEFDFTFRTMFARMFRVTAFLEAYREFFLSFQKWPLDRPIPASWIRIPNTHPELPDHLRGQLDLNLDRTLGSKGTVVLVRELQRIGILNHPEFLRFGFVPSGRLLRKLELDDRYRRLEESELIHKKIQLIHNKIHEGMENIHPFEHPWFDIPFTAALY